MNVVGKVGSLITQGVYSVATPFHPFGGAVDVIVVQQQDGTFRSTPWYVRFGKFQGVLKGTEKIVRINVNGVEANFHMYLDNAGEAYFVKEVDDKKEDLNNSGLSLKENGIGIDNKNNSKLNIDDIHGHRLDHSVSDSGVLQLKDNCESSDLPRFQRAESDVDRRYYEFEEDQSSFECAIELSEYGSGRYENLDGENFVDSPGSHPEMVLVSVDGHILTAPISESEQSTDDVELGTPQFHLGPGEGTGFSEDNEFCSEENAWAANYISNLDASTSGVSPSNHCRTGVDNNVSKIQHEVCQGEGEHTCDETLITENQEDPHMPNVSDELAVGIKKKAVFQSCLELQEFAQKVGNASMEFQNLAEESNANFAVVDENEHQSILQSKIDELPSSCGSFPESNEISNSEMEIHEFEKNASGLVDTNSGFPSVSSDTELNGEHISKTASIEGVDDSQQNPTIEDDCNKGEIVESQPETTNEWDKSHSGVEMSLCGHELKGGMGLVAAAKAFEAHQRSAEDDALKSRNGDSGSAWSGRRWRLWPIPFRKVKTIEHTSSNVPNEDVFVDSESVSQNSVVEPTPTSSSHGSPRKQFIRTNVPTNEQIASLNLKEGQNFIIFNFSTRVLGAQQVDAHIYLWKWNARIVISDVDGTITKSDVLGQFMPLVGRDWAQSGVARLFSAIKENGYQLLFLSARAIVQAYLTRNFLLNLKQDGKALPKGPIVISPDGLFPSLFREVIRRAPHEFKIACLEDIKNLFPSDYNPFYAGFGNRDTDELSYRKIGIPKGKIFIINPKGEVAISSHRIDVKSYTSLHTLVNDMFPPTSLVEQEDFNSWNFWKMPLPDID